MTGEFFHVIYDDGVAECPGGAANATAVLDAVAGDGALERTQQQFVTFYYIEASPKKALSKSAVQQGRHVGEYAGRVVLVLDEALQLRQERFVGLAAVLSISGGGDDFFFHYFKIGLSIKNENLWILLFFRWPSV